ncbi:MAG TPA: 4-hydroxy-2-oxovalerate aldolase, partial [Candidatus Saccharimonadales bacterium]|nr:4-hydroxy-2-oxovalerate aldolase [Candidatus Saccharimonadales bacterium]
TNGRGTRSKGGVDATTGNGAAASAGATDGIPQSTRSYRLTDSTLRDGSHALRHQYTPEQAAAIAGALDRVGVPVIEISHGDGLGGSSFNYGFSRIDERELIRAAAAVVTRAKLAILLVPGIGLASDLEVVRELGVSVARIATHCTEADVAIQHLRTARDLGMETVGFLMMAHMIEPAKLLEQARIMEEAGAETVYVVDSAGAMTTQDARARVAELKAGLRPTTQVGIHAHNNLSLAVANSIGALEEGVDQVDGCSRGLGAGAGNCPTEVLVVVSEKLGYRTGVDLLGIMDVAEDVVRPIMSREQIIDRPALTLGYAGVYSSFLLHAERAAERFGVDVREILLELGRRKVVGGQEDMIVDVALELSRRA